MTHLIPPGIPPYSSTSLLGTLALELLTWERAVRRAGDDYSLAWQMGASYAARSMFRSAIGNVLGWQTYAGVGFDDTYLIAATLVGACPDCLAKDHDPDCPSLRYAADLGGTPSLPTEVEA